MLCLCSEICVCTPQGFLAITETTISINSHLLRSRLDLTECPFSISYCFLKRNDLVQKTKGGTRDNLKTVSESVRMVYGR